MRQVVSMLWQLRIFAMHAGVLTMIVLAGPVVGEETSADPERISLWTGPTPPSKAVITVHHPAKGNGAAVVICPGGGYGTLVTGPEGQVVERTILGDRLFLDPGQIGKKPDKNRVFFFDLPVTKP